MLVETSKAPSDCNRRKDILLVNISSSQEHAMKKVRVRRVNIISLQRKRKQKVGSESLFTQTSYVKLKGI